MFARRRQACRGSTRPGPAYNRGAVARTRLSAPLARARARARERANEANDDCRPPPPKKQEQFVGGVESSGARARVRTPALAGPASATPSRCRWCWTRQRGRASLDDRRRAPIASGAEEGGRKKKHEARETRSERASHLLVVWLSARRNDGFGCRALGRSGWLFVCECVGCGARRGSRFLGKAESEPLLCLAALGTSRLEG